ncbi:MAG: hypothetical protein FWH12_01215 [Treponema sp.]|nr:hypothetical protein [Treponema sp.]
MLQHFIPLLFLVYWGLDERRGFWLIFLLTLSSWINLCLSQFSFYPQDQILVMAASWVLGALFLGGGLLLIPRLKQKLSAIDARFFNMGAALLVLTMNGLYPLDRTPGAFLLGFALGYTTMKARFPFCAREGGKRALPKLLLVTIRCLTGSLGLALIFLAGPLFLPGEASLFQGFAIWGGSSPLYPMGQFILYGLAGLWTAAGAPRAFQQMGLAPQNQEEP